MPLDFLTPSQRASYSADSDSSHLDFTTAAAPETPAPIFALRAFKSLVFRSPEHEHDGARNSSLGKEEEQGGGEEGDMRDESPTRRRKDTEEGERGRLEGVLESPMKSILVGSPRKGGVGTPGGKRKNVSFGGAVGRGRDEKGDVAVKGSTMPLGDAQAKEKEEDGLKNSTDGGSPAKSGTVLRTDPKPPLPTWSSCPKCAAENNAVPAPTTESSTADPSALPPAVKSYISRTDRELKRLIKYNQATKKFAQQRDQQASEISAKYQKQVKENKRLLAENEQLKKRLEAAEEKGLRRQAKKEDTGLEKAKSQRKCAESGSGQDIAKQPRQKRPAAKSYQNPNHDDEPAPQILCAPNNAGSEKQQRRLENLASSPQDPLRSSNSSFNARMQLAPDRVAAARARLRVKSEERRKAMKATKFDEGEKENNPG
ncbi:MAG: hypothetical protein Q9227_008227 [Pyrenula ochraceoflavens]